MPVLPVLPVLNPLVVPRLRADRMLMARAGDGADYGSVRIGAFMGKKCAWPPAA